MKSWRKFSVFICISLAFLSLVHSDPVLGEGIENTENLSPSSVKLTLPKRKVSSYFDGVESEILMCVEKGDPDNLMTAINYFKRRGDSLKENERVLHFIAVSIMEVCWKSENFFADVYVDDIKNDYVGAIKSARNGFYDSATLPSDFFTCLLPSLVLAASNTRDDYYEDSLKSLQKALEINPSSVVANYLIGLLYRRIGDFEKANVYFGYANDMAPGAFECEYSFARSFYDKSDPSAAFSLSEKLLKSYPQNIDLLKLCAESSFALKDSSNAELYVSRVLQIEPENSYYLLFRARILVQKGEYIRAASLLDAYAKKDSESRDYLLLRYEIQKNWNKNISAAKITIENALLLYPDDYDVVLKAAGLASETGEKILDKNGEELANQILDKDPSNKEALQIKIASMVNLKKWTEAYSVSSQLLNMENPPRSALFTHITICLSAGKKNEAWKYASKLYAENDQDEEVLQSYIEVLVSTGRTSEASRLINQLISYSSSKMKSFLYYERSFLSGSEAAILADLRSSLTANPRNKDALFRLYKIYFNKKEYRKAQYYLKQVVALSSKDDELLRLNKNLENILKRN